MFDLEKMKKRFIEEFGTPIVTDPKLPKSPNFGEIDWGDDTAYTYAMDCEGTWFSVGHLINEPITVEDDGDRYQEVDNFRG
jgi:hypothetical protein